jgi:hypothetical protein
MSEKTVTLSQGILIGIISLALTIAGSYVALRELGVSNRTRIEHLEQEQNRTNARYEQIMVKLTEIQVQLQNKKDRE